MENGEGRTWHEGDRSKEFCVACAGVQAATYQRRPLPLEVSKIAPVVLVAVCDRCGAIAAIPPQSTVDIKRALDAAHEVQATDSSDAAERAQTLQAINRGLEDARNGCVTPVREAFAVMRAKHPQLSDGTLIKQLTETLGFSIEQVATLLGAPEAVLRDWLRDHQAGQAVPAPREVLTGVRELCCELTDAFSSDDAASRWLHQTSVPALSGRTPLEALMAGELTRVTGLLVNVNNGMLS